jgi:hypothetical protein
MKVFKCISIAFLISFLSINNLEAQLLKKLKNRVKEATEDVIADKAAEKAAQESGKVLDSLLDIDPDYQPQYPQQIEQMMAAGSENIPVEESYLFNTKVTYKMTMTDEKKSSVVNYEMWFSEKEAYMATKVESDENTDSRDMPSSVISILDDKNQAMIILMEEQKMAQLISMSKIKDIAVEENEIDANDTDFKRIKKTGNTKKILGYDCEEFMSENESNKFSFWVTKELALFQKNMFFNVSQSLGGNTFEDIPQEAQGFMMEMNYENLSNNEKGNMIVVDIQNQDKTILMADYQLLNLGQFMQK